MTNEEILKRAKDISAYYDDLIEMTSYYHLLGKVPTRLMVRPW